MIYAYIAVALAVGLLIGLATFAVVWLAKTVGRSIRSRTLELVSAYDDILEERSRELAWIERRQQSLERKPVSEKSVGRESYEAPGGAAARTALMGAVERISSAEYRDDAAARLYRKIRTGFSFSPKEALARVSPEGMNCQPGPASSLLEELAFETMFTLSTLPSQEQYRLLQETLGSDQRTLAQEYYDRCGGQFRSLGFYDFLREKAAEEPHPPLLRVAPMTQCQDLPPQVKVVEDPSICEGFVLEADNCVFDYCIKTREIG